MVLLGEESVAKEKKWGKKWVAKSAIKGGRGGGSDANGIFKHLIKQILFRNFYYRINIC